MKAQILVLGFAVTLIAQIQLTSAWCQSQECLTECLTTGKPHKSCLKSCCELNADTYDALTSCHNSCRMECSQAEDQLAENECYSGCLYSCSNQTDQVSAAFSDQQDTDTIQEEDSYTILFESLAQKTDTNDYSLYIEQYYQALQMPSMIDASNLIKGLVNDYTVNLADAYSHKWFAVSQSAFTNGFDALCLTFYSNADATKESKNDICFLSFNKKAISKIRHTFNSCLIPVNQTKEECISENLNNADFSGLGSETTKYWSSCLTYPEPNDQIKCMLAAQGDQIQASIVHGNSTSDRKPEIVSLLSEVDEARVQEYQACVTSCETNMTCMFSCVEQYQDVIAKAIQEMEDSLRQVTPSTASLFETSKNVALFEENYSALQACMVTCNPSDAFCLNLCLDNYIQSTQPLASLFSGDSLYSFEDEYKSMEDAFNNAATDYTNCWTYCFDNIDDSTSCTNNCTSQYYDEIFRITQEYNQEKYTKLTFDSLYSIGNSKCLSRYYGCKDFCGADMYCYSSCVDEYAACAYLERSSSLDESVYTVFLSNEERLVNYLDCLRAAHDTKVQDICTEQYTSAVVTLISLSEDTLTDEEKVERFHDEFQKVKDLDGSDCFAFYEVNLESRNAFMNALSEKMRSMKDDHDDIHKMMTIKSLISVQSLSDEDTDALIEEEKSRRDELAREERHKELMILKTNAHQQFSKNIKSLWSLSLTVDGQNVTSQACSESCLTDCLSNSITYSGNSDYTIEGCVFDICECVRIEANHENMSIALGDISVNAISLAEFEMNSITERTIQESERDTSNNADCDITCGSECLALTNTDFTVKDSCLRAMCQCAFNFYYEADQCDETCAINCLYIPNSNETSIGFCLDTCGCQNYYGEDSISTNGAQVLFSSPIFPYNLNPEVPEMKSINPQRTTLNYVKKFILISMFVIFTICTFYTLHLAKSYPSFEKLTTPAPSSKDHYKKLSEKKKSKVREEDTFEIDATYEKVF